jgi:hypothetical protein
MTMVRSIKLGVGVALSLIVAACGSTVASPTGGSSGSSSSGTGGGTACGGFVGAVCAAGEFCDFPDDQCGIADGVGVCVKRPDVCDLDLRPTCACDGKVYDNACSAMVAGTDIASTGACPAPSGSFACGAQFCATATQYCHRTNSDVGDPPGFQCVDLPAACGSAPGCACLSADPCSNTCEQTKDGGLLVTCLGG